MAADRDGRAGLCRVAPDRGHGTAVARHAVGRRRREARRGAAERAWRERPRSPALAGQGRRRGHRHRGQPLLLPPRPGRPWSPTTRRLGCQWQPATTSAEPRWTSSSPRTCTPATAWPRRSSRSCCRSISRRSTTRRRSWRIYLSEVYLGHGFYGLAAASRGYFGVAPADLTWAQASVLAGLVQAPSAYDPYQHRALAKSRQRHVLDRLVATHTLTTQQADAAYRASLALR